MKFIASLARPRPLPFALLAAAGLTSFASMAAAQIVPDRGLPKLANPPVLVVDAGGTGAFMDLPAALAAAPEGALLLVRSGSYTSAPVSGRSLTVSADAGATVSLTTQLEIDSIPRGSQVVISGIELLGGIYITDCQGPVHVKACTVPPPAELAPPLPGTSYINWASCGTGDCLQQVIRSEAVTFVECTFHGRNGMEFGIDGVTGDHGLVVEDSEVALYDCMLIAGDGGDAFGTGHVPSFPGSGGDGLRVRGSSASVWSCGLVAEGGADGGERPGGSGGVGYGCTGVSVRSDISTAVEACSMNDLQLELASVATTGQMPAYTVSAPAGAAIYLMVAPSLSWRSFPAESGILHLGRRTKLVPLGTMPPGGSFTRPFPSRGPVSVMGHTRFEVQAYAVIGGVERYSEPRTLVVVHPGL